MILMYVVPGIIGLEVIGALLFLNSYLCAD